jgi:hypothetical protein
MCCCSAVTLGLYNSYPSHNSHNSYWSQVFALVLYLLSALWSFNPKSPIPERCPKVAVEFIPRSNTTKTSRRGATLETLHPANPQPDCILQPSGPVWPAPHRRTNYAGSQSLPISDRMECISRESHSPTNCISSALPLHLRIPFRCPISIFESPEGSSHE